MDIGVQIFLVWAATGALLGALITPFAFGARGRKPATGFFVGVLVGALGNLLLLVPLWLLLKRRPKPVYPGFDAAVAYQMGMNAALGGRREEARYYFAQVTQADPNNIGAWLYLANLATSPLEAWNYIQQARLADPAHPLVVEAVGILWPQVQHLYAEAGRLNVPS